MHAIQLQYSLDGSNFSTAVAYSLIRFYWDMSPEIETEGGKGRRMGTGAELCVQYTPRMKGLMEFAWKDFDRSISTSANDKMKALQYWLCAPLKRIYFQHGSKHFIGGWTHFDASNNTNYVDVENHDYDYKRFNSNTSAATGKSLVGVTVEIVLRAAPTLLKWDGNSFV